ncbi:MAG: sigma-70 family RNA polymerase sigma factor, partial [Phaeodactylibacter sp.]|nr:sigma-70 family RNA polymerase sigma factor [Phaeodactylibacter sp.]
SGETRQAKTHITLEIGPTLLEDCIRGERKAQFKLHRLCFPVLMGICMRYRKSEQEAASMLNVGFLKVLDNLDKYKSNVPFEAWIRRIMINVLIDDFRKNRKVRELIEYTDFSESFTSEPPIDFNEAEKQFDAEQLEAFIQALPSVSQKAFNLFAIDGYTHKEIAELLNISEGTSKWHVSFARKKLQEMMQRPAKSSRVV